MTLSEAQAGLVRREFERCWPWLKAALDRGIPSHDKEHVLDLILSGEAQLWPGEDSAVVTMVHTYPTGFRECDGWLAGGTMAGVSKLEKQIAAWATENGCNICRLQCRNGFKRTFASAGYRQAAIVLTKELN